jgi:hypothetical protein
LKEAVVASEYEVKRQGWRIECGDECTLQHNGRRGGCILVDISVSGVLVSCEDAFAENLQPGDDCSIYLSGAADEYPSEVVCLVTRREASRVGLQFPAGTES